jgi:diketogulonate reductase-like aldo/keto reductase
MASTPRFQGIPDILYGTAFKFDKSTSLVSEALTAGFRAIDTAGSRAAYREELVGNGIEAALTSGLVTRGELYVSTISPFSSPNLSQETCLTIHRSKPSSRLSRQEKIQLSTRMTRPRASLNRWSNP